MNGIGYPILWIIIPCYNEEKVLPVTAPLFLKELELLIEKKMISEKSKIVFVNDGSSDSTWEIICNLAGENEHYSGISQSRNRGHQNAVIAGLMDAKDNCDITISIDCDGQDDISAMTEMVEKYLSGVEIVYGVRKERKTDSFFKRFTAENFYRLMKSMGAEIIFNHADYRLISDRVLTELSDFQEVNIFLRGLIPLVGFKSDIVYYERHERLAGESHYPLHKMLQLAFDGITSMSIKPISFITEMGIVVGLVGFVGIIWATVMALLGSTTAGWASNVCIVCFLGGIQLISLGIIGQYIGKIYLETKNRPRYIISERTWEKRERKYKG